MSTVTQPASDRQAARRREDEEPTTDSQRRWLPPQPEPGRTASHRVKRSAPTGGSRDLLADRAAPTGGVNASGAGLTGDKPAKSHISYRLNVTPLQL